MYTLIKSDKIGLSSFIVLLDCMKVAMITTHDLKKKTN